MVKLATAATWSIRWFDLRQNKEPGTRVFRIQLLCTVCLTAGRGGRSSPAGSVAFTEVWNEPTGITAMMAGSQVDSNLSPRVVMSSNSTPGSYIQAWDIHPSGVGITQRGANTLDDTSTGVFSLLNVWHQHEFYDSSSGTEVGGGVSTTFQWSSWAMEATSSSIVDISASSITVGSDVHPNYTLANDSYDAGNTDMPVGMHASTGHAKALRAQPFWFIIYKGPDYYWD